MYFLHKAHWILLHLETPDSTSALSLGAILNSEIIKKKYKNVALNKLWKGHLFEAEDSLVLSQLEMCTLWKFKTFSTLHICMPMNYCGNTMSIDLGITNKF